MCQNIWLQKCQTLGWMLLVSICASIVLVWICMGNALLVPIVLWEVNFLLSLPVVAHICPILSLIIHIHCVPIPLTFIPALFHQVTLLIQRTPRWNNSEDIPHSPNIKTKGRQDMDKVQMDYRKTQRVNLHYILKNKLSRVKLHNGFYR